MRTLIAILSILFLTTIAGTAQQEITFSPENAPKVPECPDRNPFMYSLTYNSDIGAYVVWYTVDTMPGIFPAYTYPVVTLPVVDQYGNKYDKNLPSTDLIEKVYLGAKTISYKESYVRPLPDDKRVKVWFEKTTFVQRVGDTIVITEETSRERTGKFNIWLVLSIINLVILIVFLLSFKSSSDDSAIVGYNIIVVLYSAIPIVAHWIGRHDRHYSLLAIYITIVFMIGGSYLIQKLSKK